MDTPVNEHDLVVAFIRDSQSDRFKVLDNLGKEEHYISQMFPDIILLSKQTNEPAFIIEVKNNGKIAPCIQQWKTIQNIPATLYIIVPEADFETAKSIAQVVGLQARFGRYNIDHESLVVSVKYE